MCQDETFVGRAANCRLEPKSDLREERSIGHYGRRAAVRCTCSVKGRVRQCGHWLKSGAIHREPTLDAERRQCGSFRPFKRTELSAYFVPFSDLCLDQVCVVESRKGPETAGRRAPGTSFTRKLC
jgi:hypothetical protein